MHTAAANSNPLLDENGQPFTPESTPYEFDSSTPNADRPITEGGRPMMDSKTASTYVGSMIAVTSSVFNFIGRALGDAFWTAFGSHARVTWGVALILGMGFAVYAVAIGMQVWWLWPLQVALETLVLGAVFTAVNFVMEFVWNLVKVPVAKAYKWAKTKMTQAWEWLKGLFTSNEEDVAPKAEPETEAEKLSKLKRAIVDSGFDYSDCAKRRDNMGVV